MAYSGRCFMSSVLAGRDANRGDCAQSCRWDYRVEHFRLEEGKRPGEYIPVEADGRFTTILSSRDLNLFDHLQELADAGVDAVKIEGRMKSAYYVAAVTRSYRAALNGTADLNEHRQELFRISHRQYTTGFLLGDQGVHQPNSSESPQEYRLMGIVGERDRHGWQVTVKNTIRRGQALEYLPTDPAGPVFIADSDFELYDLQGNPVDHITNARHGIISTVAPLEPGMVIRAVR